MPTETLEQLQETADKAQIAASKAKEKARLAAEASLEEARKLAEEAAEDAAAAIKAQDEARAKLEEAQGALRAATSDGPVDECFYSLSKWPNMDFAVKPHPTKDRSGKIDGELGKHFQFKDGRYSTSDPEIIEFIEKNALFNSGVIVKINPKDEASKKAKLERLIVEAKSLGYHLVKD